MTARQDLLDHLGTGATTVCRAWLVQRKDGVTFGFTDHDQDLAFDGQTFRAATGMTAKAVQQTTGLSVDNTEAIGALSDVSVTEDDLFSGRFDDAEVRSWLVNWADVDQRIEQFRGNFGEVIRAGGAFRVELRGLTDRLNQPRGRAYQAGCAAVLGDRACGFDLGTAGYRSEGALVGVDPMGRLRIAADMALADHWFERGRLTVLSGRAAGLVQMVKADRAIGQDRMIELWQGFGTQIAIGDQLRLEAGCDHRAETCRSKFANFANFRGFPHIPGEDWLASYPVSARANDGGSLSGGAHG
jgi:uncharacterized phage protein (TIGR02218 family)